MGRSSARVCTFMLIYDYLMSNSFDYDLSLSSILDCDREDFSLDDSDMAYIRQSFDCVKEHIEDIKQVISSHLSFGKKLEDIFSIDIALCMLAIAYIDYLGEDNSLVINEIVRMAKRYSTDKSYAFVNGLLSSIYRE